jgi:hypothetical protein
LDHWKHEAFNGSKYAVDQVVAYADQFWKPPAFFVADKKYGKSANCTDFKQLRVRPSFKLFG